MNLAVRLLGLVVVAFTLFTSNLAVSADVPQSFTLDGRLYSDAAGTTALQDASIAFTVQILDEDKVCVLYEESQTLNTLSSKGYFSMQVGTATGSPSRTIGDSANSMATVFQNIGTITGKLLSNGSPCTAGAVSAKRRYVRIQIAPATMGGAARVLSPDLTIDSVPNAIVAERAETLQGLRGSDVLKVNTSSGSSLSQTNLESLFTSSARFNALSAVVDGTSTNYMRSNSASGAQLPVMGGAPSSPGPGSIWYDSSDSKLKFQTSVGPITLGSGAGTVTSVGFTAPSELSVAGAPVTTAGTVAVTWATQTANKVFAAPDGVAGTPSFRILVANDVPSIPWTKITTMLPTTLLGYGITDAIKNAGGTPSFESGLNAAKGGAATAGRVWISTDTKEIFRDNGATWDLIGTGASTGGTVTAVSSTNAYLSVATATTTPALTLNVGTAVNTVAAGNDSRITGALPAATAFAGDVSGVYSATSVDKIKGTGVAITALGTGNFLRYNGTNWVNTNLSAGDVTTGLTYTPVNKAGDTMTGLLVLSADPSGVLGAATKQYVDSSIATTVTTARTYADSNFISKNLPAAPAVGQNGQSIRWNNGSLIWEYYTPGVGSQWATSGSDISYSAGSVGIGTTTPSSPLHVTGAVRSDQSFVLTNVGSLTGATNFVVGAVNGIDLRVNTGGTPVTAVTVATSGNVGIGTTTPGYNLDVVGQSRIQSSGPAYSIIQTYNNTAGSGGVAILKNRGTSLASPGYPNNGDTLGTLLFSNYAMSGGAKIYATASVDHGGAGGAGTDLFFTTTPNASYAEAVRMTVLNSGNVGIGTTSPTTLLDVNGGLTLRPSTAAANPATAAQGKLYYDTTANKFKVSENGAGFVDLVGGGGTVSSVGLALPAEITVTNSPVTTTGTLTGAWANQTTGKVFAAPNGSTGVPTFRALASADIPSLPYLGSTAAAGGDLSGNYPNPAVAKIQGAAVSITAPADGQLLKYIGAATNAWTPTNFSVGDLKTAAGGQQFAGSAACTSAQTLTWSSLTDSFACANIAGLDGAVITTGTVAAARLPTSASAWTVSGADVYRSAGNVGIGTTTPTSKLHVSGNIFVDNGTLGIGTSPTASAIEIYRNVGGATGFKLQHSSLVTGVPGAMTGDYYASHLENQFSASSDSPTARVIGLGARAYQSVAGSSVGTLIGVDATTDLMMLNKGATDAYGVRGVVAATTFGTGRVTNAYGLYSTVTDSTAVTNSYGVYVGNVQGSATKFSIFASDAAAPNYFAGNVGIGTATPRSTLDVNGLLLLKAAENTTSATTIDFSTGNLKYTADDCAAFQFNNLKDGGSYTFAVQGTNSALCSFTAFSDAGTTALTLHMPPNHSSTTASKHTLYSILVLGTHAYVGWIGGY